MDLVARGAIERAARDHNRRDRVIEIYNFIIKKALEILPPKQRKVFYSVWVRSGGNKKKGIMEYSRRIGQSHSSNYNNINKSLISVQKWLQKSGYGNILIEYLNGKQNEI